MICKEEKSGSKHEMKRHMQAKHPSKCPFPCRYCPFRFVDCRDRLEHETNIHPYGSQPIQQQLLQKQQQRNSSSFESDDDDGDFHDGFIDDTEQQLNYHPPKPLPKPSSEVLALLEDEAVDVESEERESSGDSTDYRRNYRPKHKKKRRQTLKTSHKSRRHHSSKHNKSGKKHKKRRRSTSSSSSSVSSNSSSSSSSSGSGVVVVTKKKKKSAPKPIMYPEHSNRSSDYSVPHCSKDAPRKRKPKPKIFRGYSPVPTLRRQLAFSGTAPEILEPTLHLLVAPEVGPGPAPPVHPPTIIIDGPTDMNDLPMVNPIRGDGSDGGDYNVKDEPVDVKPPKPSQSQAELVGGCCGGEDDPIVISDGSPASPDEQQNGDGDQNGNEGGGGGLEEQLDDMEERNQSDASEDPNSESRQTNRETDSPEDSDAVEVNDDDVGKLYAKFAFFLSVSPILSFFKCIVAFQYAVSHGVTVCTASWKVCRTCLYAEQLLRQALTTLKVHSLTLHDGLRLNWDLLPKLRDLFGLSIEIWNPETKERISDPDLNFDREHQINFALFEQNFVPIVDMAKFTRTFACRFCLRTFSTAHYAKKHEKCSCPFLRWKNLNPDEPDYKYWLECQQVTDLRFPSGVYKPRETLGEKLNKIGIQYDSRLEPFNRGLATLDIESLLVKVGPEENSNPESKRLLIDRHLPVSIAIVSEVPSRTKTKTFVSTQPWSNFAEQAARYLNEVSEQNYELETRRLSGLIGELNNAYEKARNRQKFGFAAQICKVKYALLDHLEHLPCLGFWSNNYDWPLLSRKCGFLYYFWKIDNQAPVINVRDLNHWIAVKTAKNRLLDACMYLSRIGSLRRFLDNMGVPAEFGKLHFPFKLLDSYEKLFTITEFPPLEAFVSDISGRNELGEDYENYENLLSTGLTEQEALTVMKIKKVPFTATENWLQCKLIWQKHGFTRLLEYLALYNSHDCTGLCYGFNLMRKQFFVLTNMDILEFNTVSSFAFSHLMRSLAKTAADDKNYFCLLDKEVYDLLQRALNGGISLSLDRISVAGVTKIREHVYGPDAETCKTNILVDKVSMYPASMKEFLCCSLGFYTIRRKELDFAADTVMDRPLISMTWLYFMARVVEQAPMRHRCSQGGEKSFLLKNGKKVYVDGCIKLPCNSFEKNLLVLFHVLEFLGCYWHGHAATGRCKMMPYNETGKVKDGRTFAQAHEDTWERIRMLKELDCIDKVTTIYECEWHEQLKTDKQAAVFAQGVVNFLLPDPVVKTCDVEKMTELILEDKVAGFIECDLEIPEDQIEKFEYVLPPFVKKQAMTRESLSDQGQKDYAEKHDLLKNEQSMLLCTMDGNGLVLTSTLFKYYISELGLKVNDIKLVVQFKQQRDIFAEWFDDGLKFRHQAKAQGNTALSEATKLLLNGAFGYAITRVTDRKMIKFVPEKNLANYYGRQNFNGWEASGPPKHRDDFYEVCMSKNPCYASLPRQLSIDCLQASKLVYFRWLLGFVFKYCSYKKVALIMGDTDSTLLALSESNLFDCAKDERAKEEMLKEAKNFLLPKSGEERTKAQEDPMKLWDIEYEADIALSLSPKLYCMISFADLGSAKFASKGIPAKQVDNQKLLNLYSYFATLFDIEGPREQAVVRGICTTNYEHFSYEQIKKGLSRLNPKFAYCDMGTCHLTHETYRNPKRRAQLYPFEKCGVDPNLIWAHIENMLKESPSARRYVLHPDQARVFGGGDSTVIGQENSLLDDLLTLMDAEID